MFALQNVIRRVQVNQNGLKLNGTHKLLVNIYDVNILGGSVHTIKENTEAFVVASKETGLEENADKTKYRVRSRDQNAGRRHRTEIDNSSYEGRGIIQIFGNKLNESKFYSGRN